MSSSARDLSRRWISIVTGLAIVVMAAAGAFSAGYVLGSLVVEGNAAATAENVRASEGLFRSGLFGLLVILVCDVVVAWGLFVLLEPAGRSLSLLAAWLRLVYACILGTALLSLVTALRLSTQVGPASDSVATRILLAFDTFGGVWSIGLVVFGLHLLLLGALVVRSGYMPKVIGVLILVASVGYVVVNVGKLLFPGYTDVVSAIEPYFIPAMILGELGLGVWLLAKGGEHPAPS